jgi:hypothetical protein
MIELPSPSLHFSWLALRHSTGSFCLATGGRQPHPLEGFLAIEVGGSQSAFFFTGLTFTFWLPLDMSLREASAHLLSLHDCSSTTIDVGIFCDFLSLRIGRSQVYTFDHTILAGE